MAMHDILVRVGADTSDYTRGLNNAATKAQSFAMLATSAVNSVALAVNDGGNQIDTRLSRTQGKMAGFGMAVSGISAGIATSFLAAAAITSRSEEHTSELQSRGHLVCRLLLEKKKE